MAGPNLEEALQRAPVVMFEYCALRTRYSIHLFRVDCSCAAVRDLTADGGRELLEARWRDTEEFVADLKSDGEAGGSSRAYAAAVKQLLEVQTAPRGMVGAGQEA